MSSVEVMQIKVGGDRIGIIGLKSILLQAIMVVMIKFMGANILRIIVCRLLSIRT